MSVFSILYSERIQPDANAVVSQMVSNAIWGRPDMFGKQCSLGVFDGDGIMAGVVYNNYDPQAGIVELSAAAFRKGWLTRQTLNDMFAVAFDRLDCQSAIARHSANKKHLRRMWTAVGGQEFIVPRLSGRSAGNTALVILHDDVWKASRYYRPQRLMEAA